MNNNNDVSATQEAAGSDCDNQKAVTLDAPIPTKPYDYRNCQSLFGYAAAVHQRCQGICQLCGCGGLTPNTFDLWRQMTVEHILGESDKGYPKDIEQALAMRFPDLT